MKFFRNLPVGQKVGGVVGILIALLMISSVFGVSKVSLIGKEMKTVQAEDLPLIQLVADITVKQLEKAILIERAMRIAKVTSAEETVPELHKKIQALALEIDAEIKQGEQVISVAKTHPLSERQATELQGLEKYMRSIEKEHKQYEAKVEQ